MRVKASGLVWFWGVAAEEAKAGHSSDTEAEKADKREDTEGTEEHGGEQKEGRGGGSEDRSDEAEDDFDDCQWGLGAGAAGEFA